MESDVGTAILNNARRLYSDGELLLSNERYASAVALFVTAIEEIGKLAEFLSKPGGANPDQPTRKHDRKHEAAMISHGATATAAASQRFLNELGYKIVFEEDAPEAYKNSKKTIIDFLLDSFTDENFPRYEEILREEYSELNNAIDASKKAQHERNNALYLDYKDGTVSSNPAVINRKEAEYWRDRAESTISLVTIGSNGRLRVLRLHPVVPTKMP